MSEEKFDAIVVGGGLAGLTCAYLLAQAEMEVLLIDRGDFCGAKNVTGGRLYAHTLEKVLPGFAKEAHVERKVTKERIALMTETGAVNIEYASGKARSIARSRSSFEEKNTPCCSSQSIHPPSLAVRRLSLFQAGMPSIAA